VGKAPSAFGPLTFRANWHTRKGEVVVTADAPARPPGKWQLRLPDPPGYRITDVRIDDTELKRDADGRVDLTGRTGTVVVRFAVARR